MDVGPEREAVGRERWWVAAFSLGLLVLFALEMGDGFRFEKLSVPFMALAIAPLIAVHEGGHALLSRLLGWRVLRVVIGRGRLLASWRWRGIPIELRLLPVGGFVQPIPTRLRRPRLESMLIYAAGPVAEIVVAGVLGSWLGWGRLLSAPTTLPQLLVQSAALVVAIDTFSNLLPLPNAEGDRSQMTDGMGILLSPFLPRWHFERLQVVPQLLAARRCDTSEERVSALEDALVADPANPFLRVALARALRESGRVIEAHAERERALATPELPEAAREELRRTQ